MNPLACHSLIEDIVYHAVKDLEILDEGSDRVYVDDDHRAFCNSNNFSNGREELKAFFESKWFLRLCDEFNDIRAEDILNHVKV